MTPAILLSFAGLAAASLASARTSLPPQVFLRTLLTEEAASQGAVCLDGSPAAFYFFQGAEPTKFYLHQQGA